MRLVLGCRVCERIEERSLAACEFVGLSISNDDPTDTTARALLGLVL
jgi:hypothetical protein